MHCATALMQPESSADLKNPTGDLFLNLTKSLSSRWCCEIQIVMYCVTTLMQPEISADLKNSTGDLFLNLTKTLSSR
jgi:hypothetical protein